MASTTAETTLGPRELAGFRRLIFDEAGIHMTEAKAPLIAGRLGKRMRELGMPAYAQYLAVVRQDPAERQVAVDLLTTNETYFNREPRHFEFLGSHVAPAFRHRSDLRVWCAASSSGEEPWTIAMVLAQSLGHLGFEVLASDISRRMLQAARRALYPVEEAAQLPKALRMAWCLKGVGRQAGSFTIDPALRQRVRFEQINLNAELPEVGSFDVIFIRNVMIYFSTDTKREVMARLLPRLRPGGWLMVSHSESLNGLCEGVQAVQPSVYRKAADRP